MSSLIDCIIFLIFQYKCLSKEYNIPQGGLDTNDPVNSPPFLASALTGPTFCNEALGVHTGQVNDHLILPTTYHLCPYFPLMIARYQSPTWMQIFITKTLEIIYPI